MRREREEWEIYKVEKAKLPDDIGGFEERWFITKGYLPYFEVNAYIDSVSMKKVSTGKTYAFSLVKFLNYLNYIGMTYSEATSKHVYNFLLWQIYGHERSLTIRNIGDQITYSTIRGDISAITGFYKHLVTQEMKVQVEVSKSKKRVNKNSFYYGQISQTDYLSLLDNDIKNMKGSKHYIKWYTDEEVDAILSNFKTLRDKSVFLLQLEGLRIDEAVSINLYDYDQFDRVLKPSRSKGKIDIKDDDENTMRVIVLNEPTARCLEDYILTERAKAENESGKYSDWLFLNLKPGVHYGEVLTQSNYRKVLKSAAKRAGLNPDKIRTHSGRSTKVNQLIDHMVNYPDDGINELVIKELMGWESIDSINAYKKNNNKTIAKKAHEKIQRRKIENA